YGASSETQSLLTPDLSVWDRRFDAGVRTLDVGAYVDVDATFLRRLHLAGSVRVDGLFVGVDDHLADAAPAPAGATAQALPGAQRSSFGAAVSPRVSLGVDVTSWLTPTVSYGEGFRSLDARSVTEGGTQPYSKVRSVEFGLRARLLDGRYVATLALYQTWVG